MIINHINDIDKKLLKYIRNEELVVQDIKNCNSDDSNISYNIKENKIVDGFVLGKCICNIPKNKASYSYVLNRILNAINKSYKCFDEEFNSYDLFIGDIHYSYFNETHLYDFISTRSINAFDHNDEDLRFEIIKHFNDLVPAYFSKSNFDDPDELALVLDFTIYSSESVTILERNIISFIELLNNHIDYYDDFIFTIKLSLSTFDKQINPNILERSDNCDIQ